MALDDPLVSVLVPAYNEAATIVAVLDRLAEKVPFRTEVIVVDDGSTDATVQLAEEVPGTVMIRHEPNRGKGAAVRTGIARSTAVLIQDADLEYDPVDIPRLLDPWPSTSITPDPVAELRVSVRRSYLSLCMESA
jgi:glycosyltransferase involved in cell wall biosynthesis